jgi:hypothetical protein
MANELDLNDFIKTTLVQIALGVRNANEELHKSHGGKYSHAPYRLHNNIGDNKNNSGVSFDVAVEVNSGTTDKAGAKISVAQIFNIGGSLEAKSNDKYLHRIKFVVGVHTDWD